MSQGKVVSINLSKKKGDPKLAVTSGELNDLGFVGDAHAGIGCRQVSILAQESIDVFNQRKNCAIKPGDFAENLTISGIDLTKTAVLDRLIIGDVELEVTQLGKKCHGDVCAIFRAVGQCAMPKEGIFARVLHGGKIQSGDAIEFDARTLRILIVTLSDRAAAGVYSDRSGPEAKNIIAKFFADKRWHWQIHTQLIADDAQALEEILKDAVNNNVDIVFTLGGTGVGPRDITPEVITKICEKIIPGIMDNIRIKYGAQKLAALISRSVAGVAQNTQIYALPGSERAVKEYLAEITPHLEHIIYMLHGLDLHF